MLAEQNSAAHKGLSRGNIRTPNLGERRVGEAYLFDLVRGGNPKELRIEEMMLGERLTARRYPTCGRGRVHSAFLVFDRGKGRHRRAKSPEREDAETGMCRGDDGTS